MGDGADDRRIPPVVSPGTPRPVARHAEPYAAGQLTDVFRLPGAEAAPVVLLWHGSGPDERDILTPLAEAVARLGSLVFVPDWRSDDPVAGPTDLLGSIAFARAAAGELGGDAGCLVLAGWSLGADAAAAVAERPGIADGWHPSGLVGLAGSYQASPFDGYPGAGTAVGGAGRPALLAHGTADPIVPVGRSVDAAGRLAESAWRVVLRQVDTDHAGIIGTEYNPWRRRCVPTEDVDRLATLEAVALAVALLAQGLD